MFKKTNAKITRYEYKDEYNYGDYIYYIDVNKNDSLNGYPCFSATLTRAGVCFTTHLDGVGIDEDKDIEKQYNDYLYLLYYNIVAAIEWYELDLEKDEEHFWEDYYANKEREEN